VVWVGFAPRGLIKKLNVMERDVHGMIKKLGVVQYY